MLVCGCLWPWTQIQYSEVRQASWELHTSLSLTTAELCQELQALCLSCVSGRIFVKIVKAGGLKDTENMEVRKELTVAIAVWYVGNLFVFLSSSQDCPRVCLSNQVPPLQVSESLVMKSCFPAQLQERAVSHMENSVLFDLFELDSCLMNDDYSRELTQRPRWSLMLTIAGMLKLSTKSKSQLELRTLKMLFQVRPKHFVALCKSLCLGIRIKTGIQLRDMSESRYIIKHLEMPPQPSQ